MNQYACLGNSLWNSKQLIHLVVQFYENLIRQVERYFYGGDRRDHFPNIELENSYRIATVLDPRFKKAGFLNAKHADLALLELVNLVQLELQNDASAVVPLEPIGRDDDGLENEIDEVSSNSSLEVEPKRGRMVNDQASYYIMVYLS